MRYVLIGIALGGLLSCVSSPATIENWPAIAYPGFAEKIDRIAGVDGINCGLIDRTNSQKKVGTKGEISLAQNCVNKAISDGLPFKLGSIRIASTSYLYEVAVKPVTGDYWVIVFDRAMDDSENIHFVKRCKSLKVSLQTSEFVGDGCIDVSTDEWLSDIVEVE